MFPDWLAVHKYIDVAEQSKRRRGSVITYGPPGKRWYWSGNSIYGEIDVKSEEASTDA